MTSLRLAQERSIMQKYFPAFSFFATRRGSIGFHGRLKGPHSGKVYQVAIMAKADSYPGRQPAIYMHPHPEPYCWMASEEHCEGRLAYMWSSKNTFATCLLAAIHYLKEFDR